MAAAMTLGLTVPAAAQAAAPIYGNGFRADNLANLEVGSTKDRRVDYRFKAEATGDVASVRVFFATDIPKGYAAGDGGDINVFLKPDDGNGNPNSSSGSIIASHVVTDPLTSDFTTVTFDSPAHLVAGQVYHLGFFNKDAAPATNWVSVDDLGLAAPATPVQKTIDDADLAVLYRDSSSAPWTHADQHTPIFTMTYTDGSTHGPGAPYVNARSESALYDVGGDNRVAQYFTVSGGDKVVTGADFRLRRVSATGDLTVRLANANTTELARVVVPAANISTSDDYVHVDFPSPVTLVDGQSYRLMVFAFDGDYKTFPLTEGDGFVPSPAGFDDGFLQSSSNNGGAWITPDTDDDAQAFFTLQGDTPPPPPPAEPVAAFDAKQDYGTRYDLDASASTGDGLTYAWEVDGQPLTDTTAQVDDAGPLQTMGSHHAKLTVTDANGHTDVAEKDFDVVYRMWPYYAEAGPGDNDPWQTSGVVEDFPEWTDWVRVNGPWRSITAVNRTDQGSYAFQPQSSDPSVLRLEVHQGDHPTSGGADRAGISLCPNCFNWTGAGYSGDPDIQAQVGAANGTNTPRFYRLGFKMDESTTLPLIDEYDTINADGTTTHHKADIHNMVEWHGFAPGGSQLKIGPTDSTGNVWGVQFAPTDLANPGSSLPTRKIDVHQIVPGEWQDYVVEVLWRRDDTGFIKVWRNGECVSCGHPQDIADGTEDGEIHGVTLRMLNDGSWDSGMGFNVQHYRAVDFRDPTVAWYRHPAIGMSYDDVMAQG